MPVLNSINGSTAGYNTVTHCVFDMDGLLLDTETLAVTQNILNVFAPGAIYTWDVKVTLLGLQREDVAKKIIKTYNLPLTSQEYIKFANDQNKVIMKHCRLMPGAERLVRHLHDNNIPIALATSSSKESVEVKTTHHRELFELFGHKVMGSSDPDVKEGKPAPDIFLIAAKRFPDSPNPEDCLVFEDAPNGCRAAKSAGMQVVMVPNSHVTQKQRKEDATVVINSLLDFKPEDFGLPPFRDT